ARRWRRKCKLADVPERSGSTPRCRNISLPGHSRRLRGSRESSSGGRLAAARFGGCPSPFGGLTAPRQTCRNNPGADEYRPPPPWKVGRFCNQEESSRRPSAWHSAKTRGVILDYPKTRVRPPNPIVLESISH